MKIFILPLILSLSLSGYEIESRDSLFDLVNNGDIPALEKKIDFTKDLDLQDEAGMTLLILLSSIGEAIFYCDTTPVVKYENMALLLIEKGADIKVLDLAGKNAFFYAVKSGKERLATTLMNRHTSVNPKVRVNDPAKNTLLHKVARYGWANIGKYLIKQGVNSNSINQSGEPVLHTAINAYYKFNQDKRILSFIKMLLNNSAKPSIVNPFGRNAFWINELSNKPLSELSKLLKSL
jgi:ankyrin repeat protein